MPRKRRLPACRSCASHLMPMRCEALCRDWRRARGERRSRIAPGLTSVNGLGWPRSLDRTSLHHEFPANREKYREIYKSWLVIGAGALKLSDVLGTFVRVAD